MDKRKWSNVLRGVAYGDAWGYKNEFRSYAELTKGSPLGPNLPEKLVISDDTQMTLALARALNDAGNKTDSEIREDVIAEWIEWFSDPDNNRAPGNTCMRAIGAMKAGIDWLDASVEGSDGCGTVMRVSPAAFTSDPKSWQGIAAWQAISTHGKASGVAASLVAAALIRMRPAPGEAVAFALGMTLDAINDADDSLLTGLDEWIGENADYYGPAYEDGVRRFITRGLLAIADALVDADIALNTIRRSELDPWSFDPCELAGEGWRAQHALSTALLCADLFPDDPIAALRRATVTNGDSDSIAAVAGSILGAIHDDPWPAEWFARLEPRYQQEILEAEGYEF
ncbi:ADP-ribosylglycohydrolase family protein [Mycobacteroides abscessus]|uniref:ADP-ribosylglycohydrolase family protein n=1 Tax=Mycobacteroides abscessus TaxID=36809 RepID=UPI000927CD08|nr:ADP-ribosylglycohydrolase family protein [Mycobacteroides abscessus]DAZ90374.1 TPA_asm: ADP-ribosyl glycohydrolase [Mycobacterium phage prophiFSQJ01-1]SII41897.1 Probable ADP-ribosylglycohydrolase [Mycobacteroides abscessus subsp. abscessus]SIK13168.1 Probable ADP-ribosylglycohydrolase [Mycobacteroides abscessus subsp. abscessus]SIN25967.1 Probable ADP-ribosylglycohydrolase [Mycobacteroides abscessus subsp. abscessus]SLI50981.1 Probable ADP-ribosylglycohydrolase [Mycobacteroides abscessus s